MSMRFCEQCQSLMKKNLLSDKIIFTCVCGESLPGDNMDTLLFEKAIAATEIYAENPAFDDMCTDDPAANTVPIACECGMDYMVMVERLDSVIYVCGECKRRKTHV